MVVFIVGYYSINLYFTTSVIITLVSALHLLMKSPVWVCKRVAVHAGLTAVLIGAESSGDRGTDSIVVVVIPDRERVALQRTGHGFPNCELGSACSRCGGSTGSAGTENLGRSRTRGGARP